MNPNNEKSLDSIRQCQQHDLSYESDAIRVRTIHGLDQDIHLSVLEQVASTANRARNPHRLLREIVEIVCRGVGFPAGNALIRTGEAGEFELHGCGAAYVADPSTLAEFADACNHFTTWGCATVPGRLLLVPEPICQQGIDTLSGFSRSREASAAGLHTIAAIPVLVDDDVVAAFEFFTSTVEPVSKSHLALLQQIACETAFVFRRAKLEQKLRRDTQIDQLTGLLNRSAFEQALRDSFESAHAGGRLGPTLVFIDLDGLKLINDMFGHHVGDALIEDVSQRFERVVSEFSAAERFLFHDPHDILLARFSGDEFTIMIDGPDQMNLAPEIASELHNCLKAPHIYGQIPIYVTASVGVASDDGGYAFAHELMRDANISMQRAKSNGSGKTLVFDHAMRERSIESLQIEAELHHAISNRSFELHYQPIGQLNNGLIVGVEALLRWRRSNGELVGPDKFIEIAEERGLIWPIGEQVLYQACHTLKDLENLGMAELTPRMSVNVSTKQFLQPDFVELVRSVIYDTGISPRNLTIEVTETAAISKLQDTAYILSQLQAIDVGITLDDFGTGFSSLSHLQSLPFDGLKIDRSFVMNQEAQDSNWSIVTAIVQMAKAMDIKVVAEGIETPFQLAKLFELGCDYGQGFLLGYPIDQNNIIELIAQRRPLKLIPA